MHYRRGWIAAFLFSLSMINYMDRIALSIAAVPVAAAFKLSPVGMGYLFSSFIWSYALLLIPMGYLIDRFGTKRMAAWGIFVWSAATIFTGMATSLPGLLAARLAMGAGESTSNPVGAKVIRQWIPASERGTITALFNSGSYAGPAVCSVFLGSLIALYGWRVSFVIAGGLGFVWLIAWIVFFNMPEKARWLTREEREKIVSERDAAASGEVRVQSAGLLSMMHTPTLWGLAITQGCNAYTQYLFLTWLPSYLQASRHISIAKSGLLAAVPYATAVVLCVVVGRLSDRYLKRSGVSSGRRRNAVALSMLAGTIVLAVPATENTVILMILFSLTLTAAASTSSLNYALLNDLLPDAKDVAKATAFIVVGGNIFGLIAPIATGYVVSMTGHYDWAFGIAGMLLLLGAITILTMTQRPISKPPRFTGTGQNLDSVL